MDSRDGRLSGRFYSDFGLHKKKKKVLMNSSVNSVAVRDKSIIFLLLHHLLFRFSIKDLARELQRFPYIL